MNQVAEHILRKAYSIYGFSKGKWDKFKSVAAQDDECMRAIETFVNELESPALYIVSSAPDSLSATLHAPFGDKLKHKCISIVRLKKGSKLSVSSLSSDLLYMELDRNLVGNMNALVGGVYQSVLDCDQSKESVSSEIVNMEFKEKFGSFVSSVQVVHGIITGKTVLPLPLKDLDSASGGSENRSPNYGVSLKEKIHLYEGYIVTWTRQIHAVLVEDVERIYTLNSSTQPIDEIQYWEDRCENMESVLAQMNSSTVKDILEFLVLNSSSYVAGFNKLQSDLEMSYTESSDNKKFLKTLLVLARTLSNGAVKYEELVNTLDEALNYVFLIWKHSKYYNTPGKISTIIRLFCNSLIDHSQKYITGGQVFSMINNDESMEAYSKLEKVIETIHYFKTQYEMYKRLSEEDVDGSSRSAGWRTQANYVFENLDLFLVRVHEVSEIVKIAIQYGKLERVEIGGSKGISLSLDVVNILGDFRKSFTVLQNVPYDTMVVPFDIGTEMNSFDSVDYPEFLKSVQELDRRLGFVATSAFENLTAIEQRFKLLDCFEGLWERPVMEKVLRKHFVSLVKQYRSELNYVHSVFVQYRSTVDGVSDDLLPIGQNMPPAGGALNWVYSLRSRAMDPLGHFRAYVKQYPQIRNEEFGEVDRIAESLQFALDEYARNMYSIWEKDCEVQVRSKLGQKLLVLEKLTSLEKTASSKIQLLGVNFDKSILALTHEIKYLQVSGFSIPPFAQQVFDKRVVFRKWFGDLSDIVQRYNKITSDLLPVEHPLFGDRIAAMEKALAPGILHLSWNDENSIPEYIEKAKGIVGGVYFIYSVIKCNLAKTGSILESWTKNVLFDQKLFTKPMTPEEVDSVHKGGFGIRMLQLSDDAKEIHRLMKESNDALRVSKQSEPWKKYLEFVNRAVAESFALAISKSLLGVAEAIGGSVAGESSNRQPDSVMAKALPTLPSVGGVPIFSINLELGDVNNPGIIFEPPITRPAGDCGAFTTIREVVNGWIRDCYSASTYMVKFETGTGGNSGLGGDYLPNILGDWHMQSTLTMVSEYIDVAEKKCEDFRNQFDRYSNLWIDDMDEIFETFVEANRVLEEELVIDPKHNETGGQPKWREIMEMVGIDLGDGYIPRIDSFLSEIEKLHAIKKEIVGAKNVSEPIHWIRINCQQLKLNLVQILAKWESRYVKYLEQFVKNRISLVENFMARVGAASCSKLLAKDEEVSQSDLYRIMTNVKDVKLASTALRLLFAPVSKIAHSLKTKLNISFGEPSSSQVDHFIDHIELRWEELIKRTLNEKESILPYQAKEMEKIKVKIDWFSQQVVKFRSDFAMDCPYGAHAHHPMETIEGFEKQLADFQNQGKELNNLELLFDLSVTVYKDLRQCGAELQLLRAIWTEKQAVDKQLAEWHSTLWNDIDTEELIEKVKEILRRVKLIGGREVAGWGVYTNLIEKIKNMLTVLPLISDLHSESMQERHWAQLMDIAKVGGLTGGLTGISPSSRNFSFKNCLDLNLHRYPDDVAEIVAVSAKEAKIEKKLNQIKSVWSSMGLDLDLGGSSNVPLLGNVSSVLEVLETNALEIASLIASGGKAIEFCRDSINEWNEKLRTIDAVLGIWQKVTRNWSRLEPIFVGSDDIRSQLPEDSKRFEQIDKEWRDLMLSVVGGGRCLVVLVCCASGRLEFLQRLNEGIEVCERSLNDYLEQKKRIFPRFYFVSNQALLDIISNGEKPLKIAKYLGDCFDGIKTLDFVNEGRAALGLFSKDGETVRFTNELALEGTVEQYLLALERHMRSELREILESAKNSTDNWEIDKPREFWVNEYCAQLALVGCQIAWTEETGRALEELENGSEGAMREYKKICEDRIEKLIKRVQQPLDANLRNKIITVITIDVHARDVVEKFIQLKLADTSAFQWQSQLRFYWGADATADSQKSTCFVKICDWASVYGYEYIGNCGRLVITPLTDRCYLTLTQALNLTMGAAPSGPAGTGKTETTKDLSRAIGLPVVVFNCSDQMTYLTMANVVKGLASMGAWGCFDEFNRISLEVLSVVSTQVKSVLDALKENVDKFWFMDDECRLVKTVGFFITMNPGYAGRNTLPESLSSQFRTCAMVVPDLTFICENMLLSEGFLQSRQLAKKFVCLYSLCKELLSKQMHYDWGLRAVKSLLRQAGALKRADPVMDEYAILMRALRDFNTPKLVTEDLPIFLRLISDLFPGITAESKTAVDVETVVRKVAKERGLQPDNPAFVTKVIGLLDLLKVRHCVFVIGPPGCGKTEVWKTLMRTLQSMGEDGQFETLNPKAISSDELYGIMTRTTNEWKDGAISVIMRNMSKEINGYKPSHKHKWVVFDGDIDAKWIESMNSVMDDNKVLTLVSNERIPFTPSMRMILEVQDMLHASPATVSRGGVLFINDTDIGWKPFVESWRDKISFCTPETLPVAQSTFYVLFSQYFESNIEYIRKHFAFNCPMTDIGLVQTICNYIDALLGSVSKEVSTVITGAASCSPDQLKLIYESYFMYAFMWAIGGALADDKIFNHRKNFSTWLRVNTKLRLPEAGDVLDYKFDPVTMSWVHWDAAVTPYIAQPGILFSKIVVSNSILERMKYNLNLHVKTGKPALFCGVAGTGKTTIVRDYVSELVNEKNSLNLLSMFSSFTINLNSYTDSLLLQTMMESNLEKRTGKTFGPVGNKKCLFFLDDLNMPQVDEYDTQSSAMLLFQMISHKSVFSRQNLEDRKDLVDMQFAACMNPKAGSFMVNGRLQRHFTLLSTYSPSPEMITQIYGQIISSHLCQFDPSIQRLQGGIISGTIDLLNLVNSNALFLPSGRKFHYQFNLKEVSSVIQSLLQTNPDIYRGVPSKFVGVWVHELERVFSDRLICNEDIAGMRQLLETVVKQKFPQLVQEVINPGTDLIMTSFVSEHGGNEKQYMQVKDMAQLRKVVEEKLAEYNTQYPEMNLVLFDDAIKHVCRIARIVDQPGGHALLVGVGGSGKQSLARLACFIQKLEIVTISVNQNYGLNELKLDLQEFCKKAAVKPGVPHAFILTDAQIVDDRFLVYINDLLANGSIPDLFTKDEMDNLLSTLRAAAKSAGVPDERPAMVDFFNDRVKSNLHVIICHSPVGETFRVRGRKFPALTAFTTIDVFHTWPRDALVSVASKFLSDSGESPEVVPRIASVMADIHVGVGETNNAYLSQEGRYNYTTPKSFLEFIAFYKSILSRKRNEISMNVDRLNKGLGIMADVKSKVEVLQFNLKEKLKEVEQKKAATNAIIEQVTAASKIAENEKAGADKEAEKTNAIAAKAAEMKAQADAELAEAMPAMEAAKEAVNCLTKPAIQELKSLVKPPAECAEVTKAVLILLKKEKKNLDWKSAQKMMNNPGQFLDEVTAFDANHIEDWVLSMVGHIMAQPFFNYQTMKTKSTAAAYLCNWVVNIVAYNKIYQRVAPLMARVDATTAEKKQAEAALETVMTRVRAIEKKVADLKQDLFNAVSEKEKTEKEASSCQLKLDLANRLVNGLRDENERWSHTVTDLQKMQETTVGDSLLASAFVGYISPFTTGFRLDLWRDQWVKLIAGSGLPSSCGDGISLDKTPPDPLNILTTEAAIAGWKNESLPADRMSIENAAVVTCCARWPLLIDPQLQGVSWIKKRFGEELVVVQVGSQPSSVWIPKITHAIQTGGKVLVESIGQEIDPVFDPLLSRSVIRRGKSSFVIRFGGEEIEYDLKFQLILQTKLANPHYRPEIVAQCTIVNFTVTPEGLEEQILAMVLNVERPELEQEKVTLVRKQNEFKVSLAALENQLLVQLSAADPLTILDNIELITGLEKTKQTALEIGQQVIAAKKTEAEINLMREKYRVVAQEGAMLFFLVTKLSLIEHMYQYSLDSFVGFMYKGIAKVSKKVEDNGGQLLLDDSSSGGDSAAGGDLTEHTNALVQSIRVTIFQWVNRGLFERHKLVLCGLLGVGLIQRGLLEEKFNLNHLAFLLGHRSLGKSSSGKDGSNPLSEWLPDQAWSSVQSLVELPGFELIGQNIERDAPGRFKEWFNEQNPEDVKLPLEWKKLDTTGPLQKLLILKCLRPDRLTSGISKWIENHVPEGKFYTNCDTALSFFDVLSSSFEDSEATTPIFFILSSGADPVKDLEKLGKKLGNFQPNVNYHNVAMGQGQDKIAMAKLELAHKEGHWVMLQNIHLMPKWCKQLEKTLDRFLVEGSHVNFRCFLSAEPSSAIPIGILERSIKLTNEPPQGLVANLRRAFASFTKEQLDEKDSKIKQILLGLCHFHAVMLERKKFGPLGYNMNYPFSVGDLRDSSRVLFNYMENAPTKVPWDDLKYIFGEIMYGGHIVDDWDRKLCKCYLDFYMTDRLVDGEAEMVPYSATSGVPASSTGRTAAVSSSSSNMSIKSPGVGSYEKILEYIESIPGESPVMFGFHPNAEIGFRTALSKSVLSLMDRTLGRSLKEDKPTAGGDGNASAKAESAAAPAGNEKAQKICSDILEEISSVKYDVEEIGKSMSEEDRGPYQNVFLQECECMNRLIKTITGSLNELQLGLKGELTMSESMEQLAQCLGDEAIPPRWSKVSFPSNRSLLAWLSNIKERCAQLDEWLSDPTSIPKVVDLSKLFNPQSFLTAIKQICCQKQKLELDKLQVFTDVTKKDKSQIDTPAKDGAYVTGLYLEGARWDVANGYLEESKPKEMFFPMPVVHCKAGVEEPSVKENKGFYVCPTYCTRKRRPDYVFSAQLRTKVPPAKWTLAGVALVLDTA